MKIIIDLGKKEDWKTTQNHDGYISEWLVEDFLGDKKLPYDCLQVYKPWFKYGLDYFCSTFKLLKLGNRETKAKFEEMDEYSKDPKGNFFSDKWDKILSKLRDDYFKVNGHTECFCGMVEGELKDYIRETVLEEINDKYAFVYTIQEKLVFNPVPVSEGSSMVYGYIIRGITKTEVNLEKIFTKFYDIRKDNEFLYYITERTELTEGDIAPTRLCSSDRVWVKDINSVTFRDRMKMYEWVEDSIQASYPKFRKMY